MADTDQFTEPGSKKYLLPFLGSVSHKHALPDHEICYALGGVQERG